MTVFDEIRAILQKHKENMPVVATAELLAVLDVAEKKQTYDVEKVAAEVGKILEFNMGRDSAPYFGIMNIIRNGGVE